MIDLVNVGMEVLKGTWMLPSPPSPSPHPDPRKQKEAGKGMSKSMTRPHVCQSQNRQQPHVRSRNVSASMTAVHTKVRFLPERTCLVPGTTAS